jgi:hypothetical protein
MASTNVHSGSDVQQQSSNQKAPGSAQQVINKSSENWFFTTFGYWVCCKFCVCLGSIFALLLYVQINPKSYQVLHRICIWCAIDCGFEFCSTRKAGLGCRRSKTELGQCSACGTEQVLRRQSWVFAASSVLTDLLHLLINSQLGN